jgi:hypothetical protein
MAKVPGFAKAFAGRGRRRGPQPLSSRFASIDQPQRKRCHVLARMMYAATIIQKA